MPQRVDLFWKIAVYNVGCFSSYFWRGRKMIYSYNFKAALKSWIFRLNALKIKISWSQHSNFV